jgi:hypothetical protein
MLLDAAPNGADAAKASSRQNKLVRLRRSKAKAADRVCVSVALKILLLRS